MTTHAVASKTSGAVPLWSKDTAPSRHESTNDPSPPRHLSAVGRDGFTQTEPDVSPPRERRRDDDATKLSVPILVMIAVLVSSVTGAISATTAYWMFRMNNQETQQSMQADIRSIREGLASREREAAEGRRADAAELKLQMQSFENTKQSVDAMRGIVQLLQLQMAELIDKQRKP